MCWVSASSEEKRRRGEQENRSRACSRRQQRAEKPLHRICSLGTCLKCLGQCRPLALIRPSAFDPELLSMFGRLWILILQLYLRRGQDYSECPGKKTATDVITHTLHSVHRIFNFFLYSLKDAAVILACALMNQKPHSLTGHGDVF